MTTKFLDNGRNVSPKSISSEENSNLRPQTSINPQPAERVCYCCHRPISELEPFEKPEEGESEDFFLFDDEEEFLLRPNYRQLGPYDKEAEEAVAEAAKSLANPDHTEEDFLEWMKKKYGDEGAERMINRFEVSDQYIKTWECTDCMGLDEDEYWEKSNKA
jgi:hypothetical protein